MTTNQTPIDFTKVEALRKHMLLTANDMAEIFGVSRMTYYSWIKSNTKLRKKNDDVVRSKLRLLLGAMKDHGWPTPEAFVSTQAKRKELLMELIE